MHLLGHLHSDWVNIRPVVANLCSPDSPGIFKVYSKGTAKVSETLDAALGIIIQLLMSSAIFVIKRECTSVPKFAVVSCHYVLYQGRQPEVHLY